MKIFVFKLKKKKKKPDPIVLKLDWMVQMLLFFVVQMVRIFYGYILLPDAYFLAKFPSKYFRSSRANSMA